MMVQFTTTKLMELAYIEQLEQQYEHKIRRGEKLFPLEST